LTNRFQDENLLLSHFYQDVLVVCPSCAKNAMAKVNFETKTTRLFAPVADLKCKIKNISPNQFFYYLCLSENQTFGLSRRGVHP